MAAEIAQSLGLSHRRVGTALDELCSIGAVAPTSVSNHPVVWEPRPPDEVVATLRRQRSAVVACSPPRNRNGPAATGSVLPGPVSLGDGLRHLPSRALARARMADLVAVARHEHLAMNPEPSFDPEAARAAVPMDRTLLGRGVRMRVLGVHRADPDPLSPYGRETTEARPDYRPTQAVPMKLIVVDRKVALFPVDPDDYDRGYMEISQAPVVAALVALFQKQWESARPVPAYAPPELTLSSRESMLVALLARGCTDAMAAREMRISTRSVSSMVRTLMDRFCVGNRFQLGLALGAAHAVMPPGRPLPPAHEEIP